ncbi:hypothetical protein [Maribacter antarcticus]|uniref:hypothetical protein n=1 Tax=Maribacter antarcticus TaxID=505250 RepID=UPI00047CA0C8|nr:hypothetical protein [Maribacter antarcticus]
MIKEKLVIIKEANLANNCPECFNQDLNLSFYQKHTYDRFFHKTTAKVSNKLVCNKCKSNIYPVSWTQDIERMFNYYEKTVVPEQKSSKPTVFFYVLLLFLIALVAATIYIFLSGPIEY